MKAAFHKYVKVFTDKVAGRAYGKNTYHLHIVERADGTNLYFASLSGVFMNDELRVKRLVDEYKAGNFENAEKDLDRCPANL